MSYLNSDSYNGAKVKSDNINNSNLIDLDNSTTDKTHKNRKFLLIVLWIGYIITFGWWLTQRIIIPLFFKKGGSIDWDHIAPIFRDYSWPADLMAIFAFGLICMVIRNKDARKFLIILTGILAILTIFGWIIGS